MPRLLPPCVLLIALGPAAASADSPKAAATVAAGDEVQAGRRSDAQLDAERPPRTPEEAKAQEEAARKRAEERQAAEQRAAAAAAAKDARPADDKPAEGAIPQGRYGGVELGGRNPPPHLPRDPRRAGPQLTWLGFRVESGVPTVFAELTRPVVWTLDEGAGTLVYTLQQAGIPLANNRRPLDVSAFGTSVKGVVAARRGKDVQLTIRVSAAGGAKPVHRERIEDAPGGLKFLVVELPQN